MEVGRMSSTNSSAGKRIEALLDEKSFVEIGSAVTARATDFNLKPADTPSDGVITGYGTIGGKYMCTARTRPYWAAASARCMRRRSAISMILQ